MRCGACLTVFEGTDHLILDDETSFSDGLEADAALDALLDELGTDGVNAELASEPDEQNLTQDAPVFFGGFEDEADLAVDDRVTTDAGGEFTPSNQTLAPEAQVQDLPLGGAFQPVEAAVRSDVDEVVAEVIAPGAEAADPAAVEAGEARPSRSSETDDADYKAWIRPGTPDIDQMVDEVVHSGLASPAEEQSSALEEPHAAEPAPDPAAPEEPFGITALEKALEQEGVGTAPISFAPEPRRWWVLAVAAVLTLLLAAQVFYLQLPEWSRDPGTRGFYEWVCGVVGCELPEIRALESLRTRNLMVRSHPDLDQALVIDAVIVNQAPFPQRFPGLELRFTSVGGLLVAGRVFQPEEYLGGEISADDLMPVNTPVQVSLEIADPGQEAVNYTLSFR